MTTQDIGSSMRSRRGFAQLSRKNVEELTGIKQATLGKWERGDTTPTGYYVCKLADLYQCTADELLGRK